MPEFLTNPFFYIVLAVVGVFIYAIFAGIHKGKKGGGKKGDDKKGDKKRDSAGDAKKEEVISYSDFQESAKAAETPSAEEPLINEFEAKSFEEQAKQFFGDEDNQEFIEDFFGASTSDLFSEMPVEPFDYTIKEFDYNKEWEKAPEAISFDYNYDVNYEPPIKPSRIKKNFNKMNKTQKAIVFSNLFGNTKKLRGE